MNEIVWLGPMGSDDVSTYATNLRDHLIAPLAKEHGFQLYCPSERLDAQNWLEELLRRISSAAGIVCDVSGERCNVYLEFGYAVAQNVPRFLICRNGTRVHVDLANLQRWQYSRFEDVEPSLRTWLQSLSRAGTEVLAGITSSLPHGFAVLEGDGAHEYLYDPRPHMRSFVVDTGASLPLTLETIERANGRIGALLREIHGVQAAIAQQLDRPFHNGELLGYVSHTPRRDESGTVYGASVRCRTTDYFTFVATHYAREAVDEARAVGLIRSDVAGKLSDTISEFLQTPAWPLARPLTATLFLVVEKDSNKRAVFQHRDISRNFHARYPLQATAAGMIHPTRIIDQDGSAELCPEIAFLQELAEEAGIRISRRDVRILGLVEELKHHEVGFVGFAYATPAQIDDQKIPIDRFEAKSFEAVRLSPTFMSRFLRDRVEQGRGLVPLALAALALLLVHEFGLRTMSEIFEAARQ